MAVGDSNLFFNRDTKVYAVQNTDTSKFNVWELPVLAGYSFSQSTNASQITLNEMSDATGRSRRGQRSFNDSLSPAEWSFDMYARPTLATVVRAPEEILWSSLLAETNFSAAAANATGIGATGAGSYSGTSVTLTFTTASTGDTYFKVGDYITVSGLTATTNAPNGTFQITAITSTTVTYTAALVPTGALVATSAKIKSATVASTATETDFLPINSNKTKLATFDLYFILGANKWNNISGVTAHKYDVSEETTIYKIANCVVNEATMNFEIDGIATISWSGMGTVISELTSIDFTAAATYNFINNGVTATNNMIRNRLTALNAYSGQSPDASTNLTTTGVTIASGIATATYSAQPAAPYVVGQLIHVSGSTVTTGTINGTQIVLSSTTTQTTFATTATGTVSGTTVLAQPKKYGVTLTGGSITISNNINFLTPEVLGVVNTPLGHVTGTRSVSGSFTCYLDEATNGSIDLYQDMLNATTTVTNKMQLQFFVGGKGSTAGYPAAPGVMFDMGQCHLEIPTINIDDVIAFEVNFTALPSNISGTDELQKIRYVGV
jgi:hypothetical protein